MSARAALEGDSRIRSDDGLRERLERDFASAFIRIRGAHNPAPGEPCAWCRLQAEQAAEAVVTSESIRAALAATEGPAGLDVERLARAIDLHNEKEEPFAAVHCNSGDDCHRRIAQDYIDVGPRRDERP